jgi:F0F1-type ATP synthase membrane subunit b/b'
MSAIDPMNSILEQLEINHTFLYQFVLFIGFYIILTQVYLKPFQRLIEKRAKKLNADVDASNELMKAIDQKMAEHQKALNEARTEARLTSEKVISETRSAEEAKMNALKDEIKKEYQKTAQQLTEDRKAIEVELKSQVDQLAEQLVAKIKGA